MNPIVYFSVIAFSLIPLISDGQVDQNSKSLVSLELPKSSLNSKFRVQLAEFSKTDSAEAKKAAKESTAAFKMISYLVSCNSELLVHIGDYADKKFAKDKLPNFKIKFKEAKVVKSNNDSVIEFFIVEKRKPAKPVAVPVPSANQSGEPAAGNVRNPAVMAMDTFNFAGVWNNPVYLQANTAANETYLSEEEKKVFYYLNLVRMNPQLFLNTYLKEIKTSKGEYSKSLCQTLKNMKPVGILQPDTMLYESAKCHAVESGKSGYVGHTRAKCQQYFNAECIAYGVSTGLDIVICLLIDQNVPSLGHRKICLSKNYKELGVSIQPHNGFRVNAVLDFEWSSRF